MIPAAIALVVLGGTACDEELPSGVGGGLLPEAAVRTYELILPASEFLEADTVLSGFGQRTGFSGLLVAEDYLGQMDSHALLRLSIPPSTVTIRPDSGEVRVDSMPTFTSGEVVLRVDTAALGLDTLGTDTSFALKAYPTTEVWDPASASWTVRRVDGADTLLWSQPGGTYGALLDSVVWTRSDTTDTLVVSVDSSTIASWLDEGDESRGLLILTEQSGLRVSVSPLRLRVYARPSIQPDTLVPVTTGTRAATFVFDPQPPAPTALRAGGRDGWRTMLFFNDSLFATPRPCPDRPSDCVFRLSDATVNRAELVLWPETIAEVHRPYDFFALEARGLLGPADVPLARAPVGDTVGVRYSLGAEQFDGSSTDSIAVQVTGFMARLLSEPDEPRTNPRERGLALIAFPEPMPIGYGAFFGPADAQPPLLRLIVTVEPEAQP